MLTRCPDCGYALQGLPAAHTCPECEFAYTADMRVAGVRRATIGLWVLGLLTIWWALGALQLVIEKRWPAAIVQSVLVITLSLVWYAWRRRGRNRAIVLTSEHLLTRADGAERERLRRAAIWSAEYQLSTGDIVLRDRDGMQLLAIPGMGRGASGAAAAIQAWLAQTDAT